MTKQEIAPTAPAVQIVSFTLDDLILSPLNPRQEASAAGIAALAASIRAVGLMQNLGGYPTEDGRIGIVAGGRRLRALQRRSGGNALPLLLHGDLRLDPASHEVYKDGVRVDLSSREFALLHQLLSQRGRVQSRRHIEETLYSWDNEIESNTVEVHIHHLRRKLGKSLIRTIRGVGYVIDLPS